MPAGHFRIERRERAGLFADTEQELGFRSVPMKAVSRSENQPSAQKNAPSATPAGTSEAEAQWCGWTAPAHARNCSRLRREFAVTQRRPGTGRLHVTPAEPEDRADWYCCGHRPCNDKRRRRRAKYPRTARHWRTLPEAVPTRYRRHRIPRPRRDCERSGLRRLITVRVRCDQVTADFQWIAVVSRSRPGTFRQHQPAGRRHS